MLSNRNLFYASIAGAVVGIVVAFARAWWTGTTAEIEVAQLAMFAVVGALGGVLAFGLRGSLGEDDR